jgi:hypothetical protein
MIIRDEYVGSAVGLFVVLEYDSILAIDPDGPVANEVFFQPLDMSTGNAPELFDAAWLIEIR